MPPKIVDAEFPKDKERNQMLKGLRHLREMLPQQIELMCLLAAVHRAYFKALTQSGFSKHEALELTKARVQVGL